VDGKEKKMKKTTILAVIMVFSFSILQAEEVKYTNNSFARLSYLTGNIYIQRATDLGYEEGTVNMPISEGDRLGTTEGRAEIYFGRGNYVRLDHNTKIDFIKLPDKVNELTQIQIWSGNVYFSVWSLEEEKNIEIHTSDVSIYLLEKGLYRIDVRENGETEIFVYQGLVEASGEAGSVLIKDEQRLEAVDGHFTSRPSHFYAAAEDSFDRWSEYRDSQIRKRLANRYLPEEIEDFEYELAAYGDWTYVPPYGYVWVPGRVDRYWRPYYHGRWIWLSLCGWTWVPYEPWGWVTFHYGRWHWSAGLGWHWIPTNIWGPAWVSWYWGYDYLGWVPLSYYGYPGIIINNVYYARYEKDYYPYNSRVLTVIHRNQLKSRNVSKVALSQESIKSLGKIKLSKKPISVKPSASKISLEKMKSNKLLLRKNGSSSELKLNQKNSLGKTLYRKSDPADLKTFEKERTIKKESSRTSAQTQQRIITKRKIGYPSSLEIKSSRSSNTKSSGSALNRIFRYITGDKESVEKSNSQSSSSKSDTSKEKVSRSSSKQSSSKVSKGSSSSSSSKSRSSSRSSSRSGKVKKKK